VAAENETGFLIDGTIYEVPTLGSLTNGERRVLYDYAGVVEEDFFPLDGETEEETETRTHGLMRHPGFWPGLMHIAYRRAHAGAKDAKIKQLIDDVTFVGAMSTMGNSQEEEEDGDGESPPALTSEQPASSASSSLENENSPPPSIATPGNGSANGSGEADSPPSPTTASRSERSSRFDHSI
jgi:hypothetical protein